MLQQMYNLGFFLFDFLKKKKNPVRTQLHPFTDMSVAACARLVTDLKSFIKDPKDLKPETLTYLAHCKKSPDPVFKNEGSF